MSILWHNQLDIDYPDNLASYFRVISLKSSRRFQLRKARHHKILICYGSQ